jgi:hypothetical protein
VSDLLYNPQHWRDRAAQARSQAADLNDETAEAAMLKVAREYDRLAEIATQRLTLGLTHKTRTGGP